MGDNEKDTHPLETFLPRMRTLLRMKIVCFCGFLPIQYDCCCFLQSNIDVNNKMLKDVCMGDNEKDTHPLETFLPGMKTLLRMRIVVKCQTEK